VDFADERQACFGIHIYDQYVVWCNARQIQPRTHNGYRVLRLREGISNAGCFSKAQIAEMRVGTGIAPVPEAEPAAAEPEPEPEDPIAAERDRIESQVSKRTAADAARADALMQMLTGKLAASVRRLGTVAPPPSPFLRFGTPAEEELVLLYSDTHKGQHVDAKTVGGLGGFGHAQWQERHDKLQAEVIGVGERLGVRRLNIFNLGDLVDGQMIHKGHAHHIDTLLTDQIAEAAQRKAYDGLAYSQVFERVVEYGVGGNHGRIGMKGESPYMANADRLAYWIASKMVEQQPNLTWHLPTAWFQVVDRLGVRFVLNHGDDTKSWMGIPYYGVQRARGRYSQVLGMSFDYMCIGHHHTPYADDGVMMNGSMVGANEYGLKELVVSNLPSQKLFLLHPEKGVTFKWDIRLADWAEMRNVEVYGD
jgi:hypothetical protein